MNRPARNRSDLRLRARGFTLLEVMVAMLILTLIVTSSFGALRLGERSWEAGAARSGATETLRTLGGLLQRQMSQLVPVTWKVDAKTRIAFAGTRNTLTFIAPAPAHQNAGGLFEYTLAVERRSDSTDLILYYRQYDPGGEGFAQLTETVQRMPLIEGLQAGEIAYYGSPDPDTPPRWQLQWSSETALLPRLVRLRLVPPAELEHWPELLLALNGEQSL
jgi:general secretion pathway protein J